MDETVMEAVRRFETEAAEPMTAEDLPVVNEVAGEGTEPVDFAVSDEAEPEKDQSEEEDRDGRDAELDTLREKVASLEQILREKDEEYARVSADTRSFKEHFPGVEVRDVPDSVWDTVRSGIPLPYAYAFYESVEVRRRADAETSNERNAQQSPGMPEPTGARLFSPAEVRAMSRSQVRENYDRIFESMRHWQ